MPPYLLTKFGIQKYCQNEPRFNDVYSRNNLLEKTKDGAYIINMNMLTQAHIGLLYFVTEVK